MKPANWMTQERVASQCDVFFDFTLSPSGRSPHLCESHLQACATPVFDLRAASVHFGQPARAVRALTEVSLTVMPGERVALVGANGCGKSTLLRLLHGLAKPTSGQLHSAPNLRQAMLYQKPHLMRLSVQANIALGLWLRGTRWGAAKTLALEALAKVGLTALAQRSARQLSGGQQQRVAMARAWACRPQVLLLDEPTASLDPHAKREVEALIEAFAKPQSASWLQDAQAADGYMNPADLADLANLGGSADEAAQTRRVNQSAPVTLIFASHNLGQVKRLASRVIYLELGRVLADLPVDDFFSGPLLQQQYLAAHLFVKGELA